MRAVRRTAQLILASGLAGLGLAACGGGSGESAQQLLRQTFAGSHAVNSGRLSFSLSMTPSGSTSLTSPVALSFGGPFQSRGAGQLPASNFQLTLSGAGRAGSVGILSTGTAGYVTLKGTSYALPAATFQKLESSFASVTKSGGGSGGGSTLSRLGIHPINWLTSPSVVGEESVAGTATTHVRAGIDVNRFLSDLSTLLQRASSTGVSGASALSGGIPPATRQSIASSVQGARVDVWTGKSDHTLRRLSLSLSVPVTGQISVALGGLKTAGIALNMQYAGLNQPQQISPPSAVRPFSEFQAKLRSFLQAVQGTASGLGGAGATGSSGSGAAGVGGATGAPGAGGSAGTTGTGGATGSAGAVSAYGQCLQSAGTDVTKLQACASLLNGK